jgi:hypothetical protein
MTTIITKSSVLAITAESTEGTPVAPSAASDYLALQDDATMSPSFNVLETAELKNSIGKSKQILGAESPTFSMSHYLKGSGSAATTSDVHLLLKGAFGSTATRSTERNTVAGSTTSVLNVDSGEGAEFGKGHFVLIKDGTNGYSVRPIESVATDALTPGFQIANAPAAGVNLGRDVRYSPANTGHISMSIWHYLGNGGAIQMMDGAKVTGFSFSATAGELVNANYTLEGLEYHFNPIEITSSDIYLDFTDDNGTFAAVVDAKMYKDPHELAAALQSSMNSVQTAETHSVTYSDTTGTFTIATSTSAVLSLLWNTGTNTANTIGDAIGFSVADDTGATTYAADSAMSWAAGQTPSYDSSDPLAAKDHEVMIGEAADYACFSPSSVSFSLSNTRGVSGDICAASGQGSSIISERVVEVDVSSLLNQYDAEHFSRYRQGTEIRFQYTFGEKSGGNWVEGKTGAVYISSATVTEFSIDDSDGLVQLNMKLAAFINSDGDGEVYLGFV